MSNLILTQDYLKSMLEYSVVTGDFLWKVAKGTRAKINDIAGCVKPMKNGKKYLIIRINSKNYYAHRLVWLYVTGSFPENQIDHEDGNGINNKWLNLRATTNIENHKNKRLFSNNKSGCSGVIFHKNRKKWQADIVADGKCLYLGSFPDFFEAVCARKSAENKYGYHPNHGQDRPL